MKKPQWITLAAAVILVTAIYTFGRTIPSKAKGNTSDNHGHTTETATGSTASMSIDSILSIAKKQLNTEQTIRVNGLEKSISRGDVKDQQIKVFHQLAHFWGDSMKIFEPYAWYEAEAARLENSEKTLTFAAHLFLENLQQDDNVALIRWKALQAKDLFERSLKINPDNDSSKVGLGACYLFGNISEAPMEGISKIREVIARDSTNVYAHLVLAKGSIISGQYDKALERLLTVNRLQPSNLEAIFMLADTYDRVKDKANAIKWYEQSLKFISRPDARAEIEGRIKELRK